MVLKNRIAIFLNQNWLLFPILVAMVLSGLYLALYVLTGFLWTPSNIHYWLIFPYRETYWTAIFAGFLFLFCSIFLLTKSQKLTQPFFKIPLAISWSILSATALLIMIGCLLLFSDGVNRLDSADYQQHRIHLAFKSYNESGFSYYLIDCDRHTFQCGTVARFTPNYSYWWLDDLKQAKLHISKDGIVTVVGYDEQVIYEYSLSSK